MNNTIANLIMAPWITNVVYTAIRLRIFTIISEKEMTAKEIAGKSGTIPNFLIPLLNACENLDLLKFKNGNYFNSHNSQIYLVEDQPMYVGDIIKLQYNESKQWDKLFNIILVSEEENQKEESEEDKYKTFIKAMNNLGMIGEAEALQNYVDLSACKTLLDVGGGSGLYSINFCKKYHDLRCSILDISDTLKITQEMIKKHPEQNRIKLVEGNILETNYGSDFDAVLISDVIYDANEAEIVLENTYKCLKTGGKLVIRGYYADPENLKPLFGALFALNQLVFNPERKVITKLSLQEKVKESGFNKIKIEPLTELSFVLTAIK